MPFALLDPPDKWPFFKWSAPSRPWGLYFLINASGYLPRLDGSEAKKCQMIKKTVSRLDLSDGHWSLKSLTSTCPSRPKDTCPSCSSKSSSPKTRFIKNPFVLPEVSHISATSLDKILLFIFKSHVLSVSLKFKNFSSHACSIFLFLKNRDRFLDMDFHNLHLLRSLIFYIVIIYITSISIAGF